MNLTGKQLALLLVALVVCAVVCVLGVVLHSDALVAIFGTGGAGALIATMTIVVRGGGAGPTVPPVALALVVGAALLLGGCGASRQSLLRGSFRALETGRVALQAYDEARQKEILQPVRAACGCDQADPPQCHATDTVECYAAWDAAKDKIGDYREKRAPVVQAGAVAYTALATGAFDERVQPATIGAAVAEFIRLIAVLTGSTP